MKNICVICDSERDYACGFMDYVNRKRIMPFEVVACTSKESLILYAGQNPIDILLIAEKNMGREIEEVPATFTIILDEGLGRKENTAYRKVYKYQACDAILRDVMNTISDSETEEMKFRSPIRHEKEVIGVYSPCGGCGQTSFALAAAAVIAEKRKVIFAEQTLFSGLTDIYGFEAERGLGDLLFCMETGKGHFLSKVYGTVYEGPGFDMIPPLSAPEDLFGVDSMDWEALFEEILDDSGYEVLVLDIGNPCFGLLDFCSKVYMPLPDDELSEIKTDAFISSVEKSRYQSILKKIIPVTMPEGKRPASLEEFYDAPADGAFGSYVRRILNSKGDSLWDRNCFVSKNPERFF